MNRLTKLFATLFLVFGLGLAVLALQTDTPRRSPPDPGQTDTPPLE
jgi:preprotein translocase subunit SecG